MKMHLFWNLPKSIANSTQLLVATALLYRPMHILERYLLIMHLPDMKIKGTIKTDSMMIFVKMTTSPSMIIRVKGPSNTVMYSSHSKKTSDLRLPISGWKKSLISTTEYSTGQLDAVSNSSRLMVKSWKSL